MRRVYLDNNATSALLPEVFEAMKPYFLEKFGNASSIHQQGQQSRAAVEHAREQVAELVNCRPAEIVFTSGGTEGDNLALFGLVKAGDHVITSAVEHHAVLNACKRLEEIGCEVTYLPVDGCALVDPDDVRRAIRPATKLISIIFANNETGVLQAVNEIGKIAAEADVYFHTDAVQAAGKVADRRQGYSLRSADSDSAQDAWPAGSRRAVCPQGNAAAANVLWRTTRALASGRDGEPCRHRWAGQRRGDCSRRGLATEVLSAWLDCVTGWNERWWKPSTKSV